MAGRIIRYLPLLILCCPLWAQIPVGAWRDHLSWNTAEDVVVAGNKIYCSNGVGLCVYDIGSRNLDKLTKTNGLSDAGISALSYAPSFDYVIVGYTNGNLDIVQGTNIHNVPDIKRNNIYTNKQINHIYIFRNQAYLSCSFGIVVIDLSSKRISDTYIIGDGGIAAGVFSVTEYGGYFYAATDQGIKKADINSRDLTYFSSWKKVEEIFPDRAYTQAVSSDKYLYVCDLIGNITAYNGTSWKSLALPFAPDQVFQLDVSDNSLLISTSDAVFVYDGSTNSLQNTIKSYGSAPVVAHDATMGTDGSCWIADNKQGLVQWRSANAVSYHLLNGPSSNHAGQLRYKSDKLLVTSGGRGSDGKALNKPGEVHVFSGNQWNSIVPPGLFDFTDIDISGNLPDIYYVTSWGEGVYKIDQNGLIGQYTTVNSTLVADHAGKVNCDGVYMDENDILWISNDKSVSIMTSGQWKRSSWEIGFSMGKLVEDDYQQIWTVLQDAGLWVFDKNTTMQGQSDRTIRFAPYNDNQTMPVYRNNMVSDSPDGIIWVASAKGPVYYNNPSKIIEGEGTRGIHPLKTGTDEVSHMYSLLGSENVLSIAIDGAYRKWFGTETGGVFLISEDNSIEVSHFTADNSPLYSNKIHDIAINDLTGEIFFATEYGIISYRGDATSSGDDFGNVYVFPNPVRPDYEGTITITGLIKDADIKITDISGNLVYHTRSMGGMAVWDGRNQRGRRVATGVYLVFCTNDDGSKTHVTKLLFIH